MTGAERIDPLEETAAWLSDVAHDPVAFVEGAFAWGEGELAAHGGPMEWQRWVLTQIRDGLLTPGKAIQIAVASGHGIGKTALVCWITLWAMTTAGDTRGIITASTEAMLNTRLRAELRKWFRLFRAQTFFDLTMTALLPKDASHEQTWRIDLLPWNPNRPESFAGLHNAGRRILVIFDEASAIDRAIWETVMPVATDRDAEVIWCVFGNPLHPEGEFKNCFDDGHWITRHVDSRTVPITNKQEFQRWIAAYGEDSDFVNSRVKGLFPRQAFNRFISGDLVNAAMQRPVEANHDPLVLGIDVARFGDDMSVIYPRKGLDARTHLPMKFRLVGDRDATAIDVAGNPMTVIEAILKLPLRVQGVPEDAPHDLGVAVGCDRHHRFPNRPIDRACLVEDHKDAATGVVQTGERFRPIRIPR